MPQKLKPSISTKRLEIRPLIKSDYKKWKLGFSSLSEKKNRWDWNPLAHDILTRDNFNRSILKSKENIKQESLYKLGVFEKSTGDLIGFTMLMDVSRNIFQNAYLGYQVFNTHWGQGYGTEMVSATIKLAFKELKLHRLEAGIAPYNKRSIGLAKKVGLRKEGRSKRRLLISGEWQDMMIYAITSDEI